MEWGFGSDGPSAILVKIWQGDGELLRKVNANVWAGYPYPRDRGP